MTSRLMAPVMAPVYALTTAFVLVVGIGLLTPKPALVVLTEGNGPNPKVKGVTESGKSVDVDVRIEPVKVGGVRIAFNGALPEPAKVSLRDDTSEEIAKISAPGLYPPRRSLDGQTVCVEPPRGWVVRTPGLVKQDNAQCTASAITNPSNDIEFTLAKGGLG